MTNKHEKMLHITVRAMLIKTTMRCHLPSVRMDIINKSTSVGGDVKKRKPSLTTARNGYWCSLYGIQYGVSSNN